MYTLYRISQAINPNAAISIGNLHSTVLPCLAAHAIVQFVLSIIECTIYSVCIFDLNCRLDTPSVCHLVDIHHDSHLLLHGQFDCVFDPFKVYAALQYG